MRKESLSYSQRAEFTFNPVARKLFHLMDEKKSNLSVAVDVTNSGELLEWAERLGPEIVCLKTHVDMLSDFTHECAQKLVALSDQHHFLIFEDRKFADIGATVSKQYSRGPHSIIEWADLVNAHTLAGESTVEGLKQVGLGRGRALLLVAEMSSKGNLISKSYTEKTVQIGLKHRDFVIGFISQHQLTDDPALLHLTPGIHLEAEGDSLGQGYISPEEALLVRKSDLIIVGRAILGAPHPLREASLYRERGFALYQERIYKK